MTKIFRELGIERNFLTYQRKSTKKPVANMILNSERQNTFSLRLGTGKDVLSYCFYSKSY